MPAFFDQRAGKVLGPVVLRFVQFLQRNLLLGRGFGLGTVDGFVELRDAAEHLLRFTGVATQEVVVQVDLVLAEQVLKSRSVAQQPERTVGLALRRLLAPECELIYQGKDQGEGDHPAKSPVKLLCDCHCLFTCSLFTARSIAHAETDFHEFCAFLAGFVLPLLNCVLGRVDQQWVSTDGSHGFHLAARCDH